MLHLCTECDKIKKICGQFRSFLLVNDAFTTRPLHVWKRYDPDGHVRWSGSASEPAMHCRLDAHQPQRSVARQSSHVACCEHGCSAQ